MAEAGRAAGLALLVALLVGCGRAAAPAPPPPVVAPPPILDRLVVSERRPGAEAEVERLELVLEPRDLSTKRTLADGTVLSVLASVFWDDDDTYRVHGFTYRRDIPLATGVIHRTELTSDFALRRGERKPIGSLDRPDGPVQVWVAWAMPAAPAGR